MESEAEGRGVRTGWVSRLAVLAFAVLVFESVTGLAITLAPFHSAVQWSVLLHTLIGVLTLLPVAWYLVVHWLDYKHYSMSHVMLLGYVATVALAVCVASGTVVTVQGLFSLRMSSVWRQVHLISTLVTLGSVLPHFVLVLVRIRRARTDPGTRSFLVRTGTLTVGCVALVALLPLLYSGSEYVNEFPEDYHFLIYGEDRPFAPSLAQHRPPAGAFDARLVGRARRTCGTSELSSPRSCEEWLPSAHRWARPWTPGCHDPISLFSGTKNIGVENLTGLRGLPGGRLVPGLPRRVAGDRPDRATPTTSWRSLPNATSGSGRTAQSPTNSSRDFLIRTYPDQHNESCRKRMFKTPEVLRRVSQAVHRRGGQPRRLGAACRISTTTGRPATGTSRAIRSRRSSAASATCRWWPRATRPPGTPRTTTASRTTASTAATASSRRTSMMPADARARGLGRTGPLTEQWLQGRVRDSRDRGTSGSRADRRASSWRPRSRCARRGAEVRVVLTSNKVGHDFPTGPLDIIQSWVELTVTDEQGNAWSSPPGGVDEKNFIEPGSFLFKVEPVDQYGNLIDRHNLWEMVGVRFRRALFPGYSDSVEFSVDCPGEIPLGGAPVDRMREERSVKEHAVRPPGPGVYRVQAILNYRKVDQFLLNYMFGEDSGLTAPIVQLDSATVDVRVVERTSGSGERDVSRTGG